MRICSHSRFVVQYKYEISRALLVSGLALALLGGLMMPHLEGIVMVSTGGAIFIVGMIVSLTKKSNKIYLKLSQIIKSERNTGKLYLSLERLAQINLNNGLIGRKEPLYYTSTDCSGTPYAKNGDVNTVYSTGGGKHFVIDRTTPVTTISYNSQEEEICGSYSGSDPRFQEARLVTFPFSDPVALPLRYGIE